ncbi:MAG: hypothetical protein KDN05_17190, partial [Verrucomicrobiae bacterium]|nr:hypothetical protein [Verrucomicrobiae bacterium]
FGREASRIGFSAGTPAVETIAPGMETKTGPDPYGRRLPITAAYGPFAPANLNAAHREVTWSFRNPATMPDASALAGEPAVPEPSSVLRAGPAELGLTAQRRR